MHHNRNIRPGELLGLCLFAALSFIPFLGKAPLFDWDEINFAEAAREMLVSGDYYTVQINYEPFWEKPPLFFWLQVICMKIFGVGEFAARLPNAIIGIFTIGAVYFTATRARNNLFGLVAALFYLASLLPHAYFKSGIIDPVFNFFIFLGLMSVIRMEIDALPSRTVRANPWHPWLAGFWFGLATLTKGPVAILVVGLVYLIYKLIRDKLKLPWLNILKISTVYLLTICTWFGTMLIWSEHGYETLEKFIIYQAELFSKPVAGHDQPFYYHLLVFTLGCIPMSAFAYRGMFMKFKNSPEAVLKDMMLIWFWLVLILFSIVSTKIIHYSSMLYFPGAFLAAFYMHSLITGSRKKGAAWEVWIILIIGLLLTGGAASLVNTVADNIGAVVRRVNDPFTYLALKAEVSWSGTEFLGGGIFLVAMFGALLMLFKKKYLSFLLISALSTSLFINITYSSVLPKVAEYTQQAAVEFWKSKAGEDAYFMTDGYKSYAQFFYGRIKPHDKRGLSQDKFNQWLVNGKIDKPVYLAVKKPRDSDENFKTWFSNFEKTGEKNGFVFYVRRPE